MKRIHKTMLTAGGLFAALGGIAFWGVKRAEAKSGVNKAVLNNPPPQDAKVHPEGLLYNPATKPIVGQPIRVIMPMSRLEEPATVVWVETVTGQAKPRIVVREEHGAKFYVSPAASGGIGF